MLTGEQVVKAWEFGTGERQAMATRRAYYDGKQHIKELDQLRVDGRRKSKVFTNWVRYAAKMHSGFLLSRSVSYVDDNGADTEATARLKTAYRLNGLAAQDKRLLNDAITYGRGVEIIWWDGANHRFQRTEPDAWRFVYGYDGAMKAAIYRSVIPAGTLIDGGITEEDAAEFTVYDSQFITTYKADAKDPDSIELLDYFEHRYTGTIPVVVYTATEDGGSFFSDAFLTQADTYDVSRSSLTDDIKHNVDSLLWLKGFDINQLLEKDPNGHSVIQKLKDMGMIASKKLEADAQYLSRDVDIAKFKTDLSLTRASIHLMAAIPDLDETINGNDGTITTISGIALKLMFHNMIQQSGEFADNLENGLRRRVDVMNLFDVRVGREPLMDYEVGFTRMIPYNDIELVQYIPNLERVLSKREILRLLPFVTEPERVFSELQEDADAGGDGMEDFKRDITKALYGGATTKEVMANLTNLRALVDDVGLPREEGYEEPWLPVVAPPGELVGPDLINDFDGEVIGSDVITDAT